MFSEVEAVLMNFSEMVVMPINFVEVTVMNLVEVKLTNFMEIEVILMNLLEDPVGALPTTREAFSSLHPRACWQVKLWNILFCYRPTAVTCLRCGSQASLQKSCEPHAVGKSGNGEERKNVFLQMFSQPIKAQSLCFTLFTCKRFLQKANHTIHCAFVVRHWLEQRK